MVAAEYGGILMVKDDGTVWDWSSHDEKFTQEKGLTDIVSVSIGQTHRIALKSDGTVWIRRGDHYLNYDGSNAIKTTYNVPYEQVIGLTDIVAIAASYSFSIALKSDGSVWTWGNMKQLAPVESKSSDKAEKRIPGYEYSSTPVQVSGLADIVAITKGCLALDRNGAVWKYSVPNESQTNGPAPKPQQMEGLSEIAAISSSTGHNVALRNDGTVWTWGENRFGQLGYTRWSEKKLPYQVDQLSDIIAISAGTDFTLVLKKDGTVWGWGRNDSGQLGDGTSYNSIHAVQTQGLKAINLIVAGDNRSVALQKDGTIWMWGRRDKLSSPDPVQVSGLNKVSAITAGALHMLALRDDGTVWGWGKADGGELTDMFGLQHKYCQPVQLGILAGITKPVASAYRNAALTREGTVWYWGEGGVSFEWYTRPTTQLTYLNGFKDVVDIASGQKHSIALKSDGTVWSWGDNTRGQMGIDDNEIRDRYLPQHIKGLADITSIAAGADHNLAIRSDGTVWEWGGLDMFGVMKIPKKVTELTEIVSVACGPTYSIALKKDGTVWAWGEHIKINELVFGSKLPVQVSGLTDVVAIAAGFGAIAAKKDGSLWQWGQNSGVPEYFTKIDGIKALTAGYGHFAILRTDGTIWAWGANQYCQLGTGNAPLLPRKVAF